MKIITLNCALSPWSPGRKKRLPYITKALIDENPDVIFLQEVSLKSDANYIVRELFKFGFVDSFYSDTLLIVSKYSLVSRAYQHFKINLGRNIFSNIYKILNRIYGKGYQIVEINFGNQPITFVNTHLLSTGYGHDYNSYHLARIEQFVEIDSCLRKLGKTKRIIIGGDFNFDINSSSYKVITNNYGLVDPPRELKGNTFSADNLNRKSFWLEKLNQRLDHILIKGFEGHKTSGKIVFSEPYSLDNGNKLQISDHYGLVLDIE